MNTPKTEQGAVPRKSPGPAESGLRSNVTVHHADLNEAAELAIADDFEPGDDPYNSTGQHVILKLREDAGR